jgi:hypothetical protein
VKKTQKQSNLAWPKGWRKSLWIIPGVGLLVKLPVISQIPGNAWLGADGENYVSALGSLMREGFLSIDPTLHYWPAGYPLLMWTSSALMPNLTLPIMAILQSILYAFATAFFTQKIDDASLKRFSVAASFMLTLNPTLALNTLAIGYELISASVFLLVIGLFISLSQERVRKVFSWQMVASGALFSLTNFVQPRFVLSAFIFFVFVALSLYPRKLAPMVLIFGMATSLLLPSVLVIRNSQANGFSSISTNFGVALQLGAGENATGGYVPSFPGVSCPEVEGSAAEIDRARVSCVIDWYLENPSEILRLGLNKSAFFWSPWFGPLANGSMARNPWIKMNPFYNVASETQEGFELVYGTPGKVLSGIWMAGYLALMGLGLLRLWKMGGLSKRLSLLLGLIVSANWLISLATLGDHRQRVPILSIIVVLQVIGLMTFKSSKSRRRK